MLEDAPLNASSGTFPVSWCLNPSVTRYYGNFVQPKLLLNVYTKGSVLDPNG
jgi:hypothetical protein